MRIEAVSKIPDLLDRLTKQAEDATAKIRSRTDQASELAKVIGQVSVREDDWRAKLQSAMQETGLTFSADAIGRADVSLINGELKIKAPKSFQLDLGREEVTRALRHLSHPELPFQITFYQPSPNSAANGANDD